MTDTIKPSRTLSTIIRKDHETVYGFLAVPENFPLWAKGLGDILEHHDEIYLFKTPMGIMKVRFTPFNEFGVVDHFVIPDHGDVIYSPMRVIEHHEGSEVIFTLQHRDDMDDTTFEKDAAMVAKDLEVLKNLLENK